MINPGFSLLSLIRKRALRFARRVACGFFLLCALPTLGYAAENGLIDSVQPFKTCSKQLTASDKRNLGRAIQTQLAALYQSNSDFQAQYKRGQRLNDGIVGPQRATGLTISAMNLLSPYRSPLTIRTRFSLSL
ncbi:hypothetical protein ERHA55_22150 [Erwinia rhapontici]|nr:hypothetical protein [Erwinia rhapontici]BCQ44688.1 hypothetical protein ERHA55_22150 [Erwinia rhapontici]